MRLAAVLTLLLLLAACGDAGTAGGSAEPSGSPEPPAAATPVPGPDQELAGQGLVIDTGDGPRLCLGPVAESAPPQCDGLPLAGWTWADGDLSVQQGDARWGQYAVTGTWDGETFTATGEAVPLALYDPAPVEQPTLPPSELDDDQLAEVQAGLDELLPGLSTSYVEDRRVVAEVLYDDMTLQTVADRELGAGVVVVRSLLRPVDPVLE